MFSKMQNIKYKYYTGKKVREVIFHLVKTHSRSFREILKGSKTFWPLNCPERKEEQFRGQKRRGSFKNPKNG